MRRSYHSLLSIVVTVGWLLIVPSVLFAQGAPTSGALAGSENPLDLIKDYKGEKIDFSLDIAAFKLYDAPGAKIEVYYDIPNAGLEFKEVASGELATTLIIAVRILDKDGKVVKEAANRGSTRVKDENEATDSALSSKFVSSFNLDPGTYAFKIGVKDNLSGKIGVQQRDFEVKSLAKDELGISSVEFANDVEKAKPGEESGFLKDTLRKIQSREPREIGVVADALANRSDALVVLQTRAD